MRTVLTAVIILLSGCSKLVSTNPADFPGGYATLYTTVETSREGKACYAGSLTYYKRNALAQEHWIMSDGYPYYAAPGTYRLAMWCEASVDPKSGECLNEIYIDWGGPESEVTVQANRSYVVYCSGKGVKVEDRESFDRARKP
jgi:hypothetical protein